MRVSKEEINYIKSTILLADPSAKVFLFGSRTNDQLKGGDIDLLVFSQHINLSVKRQVRIKLNDVLGEQKIDIVVARDTQKPFIKFICQNAIEL